MTVGETLDPDTDARLAEHRLDPALDQTTEPGDETPRGTIGRGQLSVEARRTASALDDSQGPDAIATSLARVLLPAQLLPTEPLASSGLVSDQPTLAAIGGSGTMSLDTFRRAHREPYAAPSASSMRFMETGLAFVAIVVAVLLNFAR